jgi:tellurite resistance protein TerC
MNLPRLSTDPPSTRKALIWSIAWTLLGLAFAGVVAALNDPHAASEYVTGFLIEKSLSLDNLFVFAVLFAMLGVRDHDRHQVLVLGIGLAIVLRVVFIVAGIAALNAFHSVNYVLGALLAVTAVGVMRHGGEDRDLSESRIMKLVHRVVPANASPLVLPLVAIAAFDVMFAIDSIPAIFAVTTDTFVVIAANAWSLCGMVSLFFLLQHALARFRFLYLGLATILGYVAAKLVLTDVWHPPIVLSLMVVVGALVLAAAASFVLAPAPRPASEPER